MGDNVFVNGLAVVHKGSAGKSAAAFPDVCLCPPTPPAGPVPTPLVNNAAAADLEGGARSVLTEGNPTAKKSSYIARSTGDEAAQSTGGGVVTHVVKGKAYFASYSMDVLIEGENVPRHLDLMTHNHASPTPNTGPWPWLSSMSAAAQGIAKAAQKGTIEVQVVNKHGGAPVEGATVSVGRRKATTDANGKATIDKVRPGRQWLVARMVWPSEDCFVFVTHYPKTTISRKAESDAATVVEVTPGGTAQAGLEIEVYRPLVKVVLHRNHIHPTGDDKFGHWWTVIDDTSSYGWWPKYLVEYHTPPDPPRPLPADPSVAERAQHLFDTVIHSARAAVHSAKTSSAGQLGEALANSFAGVAGDLNGTVSYRGRLRRKGHPFDRDPHHNDTGEFVFRPVLHDCRMDEQIKDAIRAFALGYVGEWSWRFEAGNNCHTFQKRLLEHCELREFKDER